MKSGLEDRNKGRQLRALWRTHYVSMKSGLEDRNNAWAAVADVAVVMVSMKSGLEDRNNSSYEEAVRRKKAKSQ